ncbi:MAG: GTP-binding protein [Burkholderiales bacterium]
MKPRLANVPTHVVSGGSVEDRTAVIEGLIAGHSTDELIAVMRAGIGTLAAGERIAGQRVIVQQAPIGCACCTARVTFRIALVRLLRELRPARLIVEFGPGAHVDALRRQLTEQSFAEVLHVIDSVDLDDAAQARAPRRPRIA